jgi:hypothetical protein
MYFKPFEKKLKHLQCELLRGNYVKGLPLKSYRQEFEMSKKFPFTCTWDYRPITGGQWTGRSNVDDCRDTFNTD